MSGRKSKTQRAQPENKVMVEINIKMYEDESIRVSGPTDNFLIFRNVMNTAERAVLNKIASNLIKAKENKIVKPGAGGLGLVQ